jgi:membrane protein DedA with SNARE-associated domain
MPLAGYNASQGDANIVLMILAGSFGSVLGAVFWYYIGLWFGCHRLRNLSARHGRWVTISPKEIDSSMDWFRTHSGKMVFLGRLIPTVRTLISIPAGIAEMSMTRFLIYSTAGTVIWTALLTLGGYFLGSQWEQVGTYMNPITNVVFAGIVIWYLYRVYTFDGGEEAAG